jgi:hypothetical protein
LGGRVRLEGLGWKDWFGRVLVKGLGRKDRVAGLERKGWGALSRKDGGLESGRVELEGLELEGLDSGRVGVEGESCLEWKGGSWTFMFVSRTQ